MKTETIKAIFTNILFLIGVIVLFAGFSKGTLTITRVIVFDEYPLEYYAETRCSYPTEPVIEGEIMPINKELNCLENVEHERRIKLTDDVVNSITMLAAGLVLTLSFRRFIFR